MSNDRDDVTPLLVDCKERAFLINCTHDRDTRWGENMVTLNMHNVTHLLKCCRYSLSLIVCSAYTRLFFLHLKGNKYKLGYKEQKKGDIKKKCEGVRSTIKVNISGDIYLYLLFFLTILSRLLTILLSHVTNTDNLLIVIITAIPLVEKNICLYNTI